MTAQNQEPCEYNIIQAGSLTPMILTFRRLMQEDYYEPWRPCFKEKESEVKV